MNYSAVIDLVLDNIKKFVFPEEWLNLDCTLSKQDVFAMLLINRHGEIIMSRIADYVNIPMSTATGIIDRLVKNGYCVRRRSESDRRVVVISLTEKAKKIISAIKSVGNDYFEHIMQALTPEEQKFLSSIILKIMGILNNQNISLKNKKEKGPGMQKIKIE
ncbi:MAG: MarR family transcriptional regulator [Chitinispirillaceae bacterium]|nr:MarR family transcriptional regulator [Chitinispirillaceae bacterium]